MISVGDLVVSLCGHDRGKLFIVIGCDDFTVTIADGKLRKTTKQKIKNIKHVSNTGIHTDLINNVPQYAVDATIRREIKRLEKLITEV